MMYLFVNIALLFILIVMLPAKKNTGSHPCNNAYLVDSYGKHYKLGFHTSFGAGSTVDYKLQINDRNREKEFQEYYSDIPLFEIHRGEEAYYLRKTDPEIDIRLQKGEQVIILGDDQYRLTVGSVLDVQLELGCGFSFEFSN